MVKKYYFQHRIFWYSLTLIYLALFLINYVEIHYEINFDIASPVFEPTYHLILRNIGLINGGDFSRYTDSLTPLTYNFPYFILSIALLTVVIVSILFVVQKVYYVFRNEGQERS